MRTPGNSFARSIDGDDPCRLFGLGQNGPAAALDGWLARSDVAVCGPVAAELLSGTPASRRDGLWSLLVGLQWVELNQAEWRRVGEISARLRERGTPIPLTDIEIAVAAAASNADLWTRDADFDSIAAVMPDLRRFSPDT